ncbi:hypothetical protein GOBAR_DD31658 [Gossypium barbadense]|nr:hypothetical protein GOBAR_DD31658 [Gossypium barbadense]
MVEVDVVIHPIGGELQRKMVKLGIEEGRTDERKAWRRGGEISWELEPKMRKRFPIIEEMRTWRTRSGNGGGGLMEFSAIHPFGKGVSRGEGGLNKDDDEM